MTASPDPIVLRSEALEAAVAPAIGGSIARFDHVDSAGARTPVLRGGGGGETDVLAMGCFPLVPYCNRIRDGRFRFRGREIVLRPNLAGDPSPLHGQGWLLPWEVEQQDESGAALLLRHRPGEWPWAYEARQQIRLDGTGLAIRLTCRNLDDAAMPCGLGQHPYYPCTPETELDTVVADVWTVDEKILPVARRPADGHYDMRRRRICGQELDNGFSGWSGIADIRTKGAPFSVRLSSPNAGYFQVYSPSGGGYFVAEPVTHANAALNEPEALWPALGLKVLQPGEELALDARIDLVMAGASLAPGR